MTRWIACCGCLTAAEQLPRPGTSPGLSREDSGNTPRTTNFRCCTASPGTADSIRPHGGFGQKIYGPGLPGGLAIQGHQFPLKGRLWSPSVSGPGSFFGGQDPGLLRPALLCGLRRRGQPGAGARGGAATRQPSFESFCFLPGACRGSGGTSFWRAAERFVSGKLRCSEGSALCVKASIVSTEGRNQPDCGRGSKSGNSGRRGSSAEFAEG